MKVRTLKLQESDGSYLLKGDKTRLLKLNLSGGGGGNLWFNGLYQILIYDFRVYDTFKDKTTTLECIFGREGGDNWLIITLVPKVL